MFFYIGKDCPLHSLIKVRDNLWLDEGWNKITINNDNYWFKGYSLDCVLSESIKEIVEGYKPTGKWAVISEQGSLYHPVLRGFPLYEYEGKFTNIPLEGYSNVIYSVVKINRDENKISLDEAAVKINDILHENITNFFKYNNIDRLRVLFSAGIDTLTVWSIVDKMNIDYNLYIHEPKVLNQFGTVTEYKSDLVDLIRGKFWGYKMTSVFKNTNWYLTGFYSERMQLREVNQGHAIANYKNKLLHTLPKKSDYLYYFLQRPSNKINNEPKFTTENDLLDYCNASIFFDYQMWHIDNNFHFSPFYDFRITEVINQLSLDDITSNGFDAIIQKKIIQMNNPEFLSILSDFKNERNIWRNYRLNFKNIVLRDNINIFFT